MNDASLFDKLPDVAAIAAEGKHRRYPKYARSESNWLGELPAHWKARRLKYVATSRPSNVDKKSVDGEVPVRLCNYVDVYKNDYITPCLDFLHASCDVAELAKFRLRRGDVLITKDSEEWNDIAVPAFVTQDFDDVACGYHLSQVRPRQGVMDGEYLFRAFRAGAVSEQFQVSAKGVTRFGIAAGAIGDVMFPVPPIDEQVQIALFLRDKTDHVDRLIAQKTRLSELLVEKRRACITRLVTQGTNAEVTFKKTGNLLLPRIPESWTLLPFRRFIESLDQGWSPQADQRLAETDEWGILKVGAVFRGRFREAEHKALPTGVEPESRYEVKPGDFLMTRGNTPELVADVCVVPNVRPRLLLSDLHYRITLDERRLHRQFAALWFLSTAGRSQIEADARGTSNSMVKVSQGHIRSWLIPLPCLEEQALIVKSADDQMTQFDSLETEIRQACAWLREYRSALITAAVTGRIDVQHHVHKMEL